jgi:VanZ family protein
MKKFITNWYPSCLVLAVILYATLASHPLPDDSLPLIPYLDKWIHAIMMGGFVGAIAFDWKRADRSRQLTFKVMMIIGVCVMIFGASDELMQLLANNGRSGEWLDLAADIVGALVAVFTAPPAINAVLRSGKSKA